MTSVLLIAAPGNAHLDAVVPRRVRLLDRLVATLFAHRLDRRLAAGTHPERSAALSLRARRLIAPDMGATLARGLSALAHEAREGRARRGPVPARLGPVRAVAGEIEDLARRLVDPAPAAVAGIAQVRVLLTDGRSPLYSRLADEALGDAVRRARAALEIA
jgi:hypothetical protein